MNLAQQKKKKKELTTNKFNNKNQFQKYYAK